MKKLSRLGQWDGPRRSSRGHESLLCGLCGRPALLRLGVVFVAALALTGLAYVWGLPFPYRIGEVWAHDVRARVAFSVVDEEATEKEREARVRALAPDLR